MKALRHAQGVQAACTRTWTGASSTNWTTSGNWSPSGAPGATDYACIASGTNSPTITAATDVSIAGMDQDGLTLTVNGTLALTDTSGTKSSLMTGGTIAGSGTVTVASGHAFTWNAGTMNGTGSTTVANGGTLAIDLAGNFGYAALDQRVLTNNGTMTYVPSPGGFAFVMAYNGNATTFTNNGTFTYNGTNANDFGISSGGDSTIVNNGTFSRATGSATGQVVPAFDNNGTIAANAGTLQFTGTFPSYDAGTKTLTKGTYSAKAKLQFLGADVVTNAGGIVLDGSGAQIQDTAGNNALANLATNTATGSLTVKNGKTITTKAFGNAGAVTIGPGSNSSLTAPSTGYTQSGGTTSLTDATSKLIASGASGKVVINGGTLSGIGTVQAPGSPGLTNAATVSPGLSQGTLTVTGSYSQSGSLPIEIGGAGAGQFDVVNVSGAATLSGTLTLSTVNGFSPAVGQTFTIMSYASHTGCFTTINGRDLGSVGAGIYYDVACNATNVVVTVKRAELSINDVTVSEGNSGTVNANFTVSLNQARPDLGISVDYATADGTASGATDYQPKTGSLSWLAGDGSSRTVTVAVAGDTLDEVNETFFVNLSNASNAFTLDSQGQGTIQDDDPPVSMSINDIGDSEGNSGTKPFTFTVSLSGASGKTVTVNYATADGTAQAPGDYQAATGTLTFNPGVTSNQVVVAVVGDSQNEPDETFFVNLSDASNATISDSQGQATVLNDDSQPIITGFDPAAQKVGKVVSILGSGFTGATKVSFAKAGGGAVDAEIYTVVGDGRIDATVPKLATTGTVSVTTPGGTGTSTTALKIKPKVKTFTPSSGPPGTVVTITGTSFTGATKVQFNGTNATFTVVSDSKVTATVPAGATTGQITVITPGGKAKSKAVFTVT
jgi:hypothetical protein